MITNELLSFIKEALAKGTTEEAIGKMLKDNGGWDDSDIREAFDAIGIYSSTYQGAVSKAFQGAAGADAPTVSPEGEAGRPVRITIREPSPAPAASSVSEAQMPREFQGERVSAPTAQEGISRPLGTAPGVQFGNMRDRMITGISPNPAPSFSPSAFSSVSAPQSPVSTAVPKLMQSQSKMEKTAGEPARFAASAPGVGDAFAAVRGISTGNASPDLNSPALPPLASPADNNQFLKSFAAKSGDMAKGMKESARVKGGGKGHGFLYFLLFLFLLLALVGGVSFAYLKGYIPGISIPFLDSVGSKFPSFFTGKSAPDISLDESGNIVIGDALGTPDTVPQETPPQNVEYYNDRIFIALPAGTPMAVTTLASTIAGELRGRVETCTYNIGNNGCIIITPVQSEAELEAAVLELKSDKRISGAERVPIPEQ